MKVFVLLYKEMEAMVLCLLGGGSEGVCAALLGDVGYGVVFVRRRG